MGPGRSPRGHEPLAQRLKRVFKIDIETCEPCGGTMKVIARIEDPAVVKRMLAPLDNRQGAGQHPEHPPTGAAAARTARPDEVARRLITTHAREA